MKVLVTGANGYIGKHVVSALCERGHRVQAVDFKNDGVDERASFMCYDILEEPADEKLYDSLGRPEVVIHLAWKDGFNHASAAHLENLHKHFAFIKNMIDAGAVSISIMGTMHEIGYFEGAVDERTPCNPLSLYGIAKNALRQAVLAYADGKNTKIKWLRAYYITGDDAHNRSVFAKIMELAEAGKKHFPFTSGDNKCDFIDIRELAAQIARASVQNEVNGIINVCSGKPVSLKDKVEAFINEKHLDIRPDYGAYPARKYDSPCIYGNNARIRKIMEA